MTVLLADGTPLSVSEDQWLVRALFSWLSDDRVRKTAVRQGCTTRHDIGVLGGMLDYALRKGKLVSPKALKVAARDLLVNRKVRRMIARVVLEQQRSNYETDPEAPDPETPRKILRDLQEVREQLSEELDSKIVRPF